jgi:hypothetical protein
MAPAFSSSGRRPPSTGTAALSQPGMASAIEVTIRDSSGVLGPGRSCRVVPDGSGGPDLTITEPVGPQHVARGDAERRQPALLQDEGCAIAPEHGFRCA